MSSAYAVSEESRRNCRQRSCSTVSPMRSAATASAYSERRKSAVRHVLPRDRAGAPPPRPAQQRPARGGSRCGRTRTPRRRPPRVSIFSEPSASSAQHRLEAGCALTISMNRSRPLSASSATAGSSAAASAAGPARRPTGPGGSGRSPGQPSATRRCRPPDVCLDGSEGQTQSRARNTTYRTRPETTMIGQVEPETRGRALQREGHVHPDEAGDQGGHGDDRGPAGQLLHGLVEPHVVQGQAGVEDRGEGLAQPVGGVGDPVVVLVEQRSSAGRSRARGGPGSWGPAAGPAPGRPAPSASAR